MKNFLCLLTAVLFFCSCEEFDFQIENLNDDTIQVLGHGGMGIHSLLPMNSMESVANCIEKGAHGTELDVQLTKDGFLVAFHDEFLSESSCGTGLIRNSNWEDLSNVYYTDYNIFTNYKLQLVADIIESYNEYVFSFDCKLYTDEEVLGTYYEDFSDALSQLIDSNILHCYIESQNAEFLSLCMRKCPSTAVLYYPENFEDGIDTVLKYEFHGLSISTDKISAQQVEYAHSLGKWISLWNVHTLSRNNEAVEKSPDCIQADKLNNLISLLE